LTKQANRSFTVPPQAGRARINAMRAKALPKEFGGRGRVNTIDPGPVATDLWFGGRGGRPP
jgi:NAD(P)-dependent dehydrogenase (short-subunit alcohol dehydrogenase family)